MNFVTSLLKSKTIISYDSKDSSDYLRKKKTIKIKTMMSIIKEMATKRNKEVYKEFIKLIQLKVMLISKHNTNARIIQFFILRNKRTRMEKSFMKEKQDEVSTTKSIIIFKFYFI